MVDNLNRITELEWQMHEVTTENQCLRTQVSPLVVMGGPLDVYSGFGSLLLPFSNLLGEIFHTWLNNILS